MVMEAIYVEQKLRELRGNPATSRRDWVEPGSEVPRAGVGRVHEVFRRIVQDAEPSGRSVRWLRPRRA